MKRASSAGEARIHLGLVYCKDTTMKTAAYMMRSALRFSSYVEYLVGKKIDWTKIKSQPILTVIPRTSLVTPGQFDEYGMKLNRMYEQTLLENPGLSYLGEHPNKLHYGKVPLPKALNASFFQAAYSGSEVGISPSMLKDILLTKLHEEEIKLVFNRTVVDVRRNDLEKDADRLGKLRVVSNVGEHDFDVVVNCLWEARVSIDEKLGVNNRARTESYRFRAGLRLPIDDVPPELPSISIVNGFFGDFIRHDEENNVYFSWHPLTPEHFMNTTAIQEKYDRHVSGDNPSKFEKQMILEHKRVFRRLFPGYDTKAFDSATVKTGYIVGNGETGVDDPQSGLHERSDPPHLISDGYISVKTQKLTAAPYNTFLLEQEVFRQDSLLLEK